MTLTISTSGLQTSINALGSTAAVLTSANVTDENSFSNTTKVSFPPCLCLLQCLNDHMSLKACLRFVFGFGLVSSEILPESECET
jgi:hypothetical protein